MMVYGKVEVYMYWVYCRKLGMVRVICAWEALVDAIDVEDMISMRPKQQRDAARRVRGDGMGRIFWRVIT